MRLIRTGIVETTLAYEKHNMYLSSEYVAWQRMNQRCHNPRYDSYKWYGARGIQVCDEWRKSFLAFYKHIGDRPSPKHSVDRINVNGDYTPGNVRWATWKEQANNKRK